MLKDIVSNAMRCVADTTRYLRLMLSMFNNRCLRLRFIPEKSSSVEWKSSDGGDQQSAAENPNSALSVALSEAVHCSFVSCTIRRLILMPSCIKKNYNCLKWWFRCKRKTIKNKWMKIFYHLKTRKWTSFNEKKL